MKSGMFVAIGLVATMVPAAAAQTPSASQPELRRDQIHMMEGVLAAAVRTGAEQLGRKMQTLEPNLMLLSGSARARGFVLDGYGVFFDVEIPAVRQSVAWSVRQLDRDRQLTAALASLRQSIDTVQDPQQRARIDEEVRRLERQVVPVSQRQSAAGATQAGSVTAQTIPDDTPSIDPNEEYTDVVKLALVDAMLEYSGPMKLGPDEWLTIAARDSEGPLMPGEVYDAATIVFRVKGSDLTAYRTGQLSKEDARRRVDVREF